MFSLRLSLIGAGLLAAPAALATNFLVVVLDDVGVDKVSAYAGDASGYAPTALPDTATIDSLAASGLRFAAAWAEPMCSPTRAAMYTGLHPFRTGIGYPLPNAPELSTSTTTIAEALASTTNGRTPHAVALFGKWHLGSTGESGGTAWDAPASGTTSLTQGANPVRHGFTTFDGSLDGEPEDYWDWTRVVSAPGSSSIAKETGYATNEVASAASTWIQGQSGPWFAMVALHAPHIDEDKSDAGYDARHQQQGCARTSTSGTDPLSVYRTMTECADRSIGTLLGSIPAATLRDTLIFVIGDNGTDRAVLESSFTQTAGSHTQNGKGTLYESGVRVPFVVATGANWLEHQACAASGTTSGCAYSAGLVASPGRRIGAPIVVTDLFATLADYGGVSATAQDSVSLRPCLEASGDCASSGVGGRTVVYAEDFKCTGFSVTCSASWTNLDAATAAVRKSQWKLVASYTKADGCLRYELYDLSKDRWELSDQASAKPARKSAMVGELQTIAPGWATGKAECS